MSVFMFYDLVDLLKIVMLFGLLLKELMLFWIYCSVVI